MVLLLALLFFLAPMLSGVAVYVGYVGIALLLAVFVGWLIRFKRSWFRTPRLAGRAVLITGCDTGFGRALAVQLHARGFRVFANVFSEVGESELREHFNGRQGSVAVRFDVSDPEQVKRGMLEVERALGPGNGLYALVANAGIMQGSFVEATPLETYKKVMDVNYLGVVSVVKAGMVLLKRDRLVGARIGGDEVHVRSRVVVVSSVAGRLSTLGMSAYCASKFATSAFADSLRQELRHHRISVAIVEPAFMKTQMVVGLEERLDREWAAAPVVRREYGEDFIASTRKTVQTFQALASNPQRVVDALIFNVETREPCSRTMVGWDAHLLWGPLAKLCGGINDVLLSLIAGRPVPVFAKHLDEAMASAAKQRAGDKDEDEEDKDEDEEKKKEK